MRISTQNDILSAYKDFRTNVFTKVSNGKQINNKTFSCSLSDYCDMFLKSRKKEEFNRSTIKFAEMLVGQNVQSLAGIVYSFLIKLNIDNPVFVEQLAQNAFNIAKRTHDPVHIMARGNDLVRIFSQTQPNSPKYLKTLFEVRRALVDICTDYNKVKKRYNSVTRKMKPVENYEKMLGAIQFKISKALVDTNKTQAKSELLTAIKIFKKYNYFEQLAKAEKLLESM